MEDWETGKLRIQQSAVCTNSGAGVDMANVCVIMCGA